MAEAAWAPSARYPDPAIVALDPAFKRHHLALSAVERLWTGSRWGEGPVWIGDLRCLLWSDIPNNRVLKWEEETGAVSVWQRPSNNANGHTRDRQGRLVSCEHLTRRVTRTEHDGRITVLMDRYAGVRERLHRNGFRLGRARLAVLSARVGSIGDNRLGGWHGYRAAKAALNATTLGAVTASVDLAVDGGVALNVLVLGCAGRTGRRRCSGRRSRRRARWRPCAA